VGKAGFNGESAGDFNYLARGIAVAGVRVWAEESDAAGVGDPCALVGQDASAVGVGDVRPAAPGFRSFRLPGVLAGSAISRQIPPDPPPKSAARAGGAS
jgi:hypothetical protein